MSKGLMPQLILEKNVTINGLLSLLIYTKHCCSSQNMLQSLSSCQDQWHKQCKASPAVPWLTAISTVSICHVGPSYFPAPLSLQHQVLTFRLFYLSDASLFFGFNLPHRNKQKEDRTPSFSWEEGISCLSQPRKGLPAACPKLVPCEPDTEQFLPAPPCVPKLMR